MDNELFPQYDPSDFRTWHTNAIVRGFFADWNFNPDWIQPLYDGQIRVGYTIRPGEQYYAGSDPINAADGIRASYNEYCPYCHVKRVRVNERTGGIVLLLTFDATYGDKSENN